MNENKLKEYAKLIVKIGANVQEGQVVRLQVGVDQVPLAKLVTEECYKAGAKRTSTGCSAPHVWRVPSSKALSCKHERLFDLLTLASYYKICQINIHTNASNFIIKQSLRDNHIFDCLSSSVYLLVLQIIHYYSAFDFANIAISPTPFKTIVGRYA